MSTTTTTQSKRPASSWRRRLLVHGMPLAAAVALTALVTSALEPVPSEVASVTKGLDAVWAPSTYRGTVDQALGDFIRPLQRLLGLPATPTTAWHQPSVGGTTSAAVEATTYQGNGHISTALRTGASLPGGAGMVPWETFDTIPLTTDTKAIVDQGNGNLIIKSTDGSLNTVGVDLGNDRYWNSISTYAGSLGGEWSSSLSGFDTGLNIGTTNRYYVGPSGNTETFKPDGNGGWTQPPSFDATLAAAGSGYTLTMNDSGEVLTFNSAGWITSDVDQNGLGNTYAYDGSGQVTKVTETSGRFFSLAWSTTNPSYITSITDSANRVTSYTHDSSGRLTRVDSPGSYWETYSYNSAGLVSEIQAVGPNSSTQALVDFTYDSSNRVLSISQGTVGSTSYARTTSYSGWGASSTVSVTDGDGHVTQRGISASNVPISSTDPLGRKASWTHNANGDVTTYTAPNATSSTSLTYNANNSQTSATVPTGASTTTTYGTTSGCSGSGGTPYDPHCTIDPSGDKTALKYDANGNVLSSTDATSGGTSAVTTYTYASASGGCYTTGSGASLVVHGLAGQVCSSKTPNGNVTTYEYDASGNQTAVDAPAPLGRTTASYDSLGRVTSSTDGNGKTTTYSYNVRDQVVSTTYDGGAVMTTTYSPNALQAGTSIDTNNKDSYTYDVLGQLLTETTKHNAVTKVLTYAYDSAGNLLTYNDMYGTVTYGYDAANELTSLTEPGGTCASGTPAASSGCVKFGYDVLGDETSRTFPGGAVVTTTRDSSGRPTRITAKDASGAIVYDKGYDYSLAGSDTADVQKTTSYVETGVPGGATTTYSYDSLNRVVSAVEAAGGSTNASWAYAYDADGNRTKQVLTGAVGTASGAPAVGTTTATYNAADQLAATSADHGTWTYDSDGQQLTNGLTAATATYNDRSGTTATGTGSYVTYGAGNTDTYARTDSSVTTSFTNSSVMGLMGEDYGNQRIYDRSPDGSAIGSRLGAGSKYYFIQDNLGSVVGIFDKDGNYYGGYTYGPYGEARFTSGNAAMANNHLRYISGYYDTSNGLYKLGARYYDPTTGRFTQMDPSRQEANNYLYSAANPIDFEDPSGLVKIAGGIGWEFFFWWGVGIKFSKSVTKAIANSALMSWSAGVASICGFLSRIKGDWRVTAAAVACGVVVAGKLTDWKTTIQKAASQGRCVQFNIPWGTSPLFWFAYNVKCGG